MIPCAHPNAQRQDHTAQYHPHLGWIVQVSCPNCKVAWTRSLSLSEVGKLFEFVPALTVPEGVRVPPSSSSQLYVVRLKAQP